MRDFMTALLECSVSMSVLVLGFIALTPWLSKRYSAKWLYYVWLMIVAGLIIPFRLHPDTALIQMSADPSYIQKIMLGNTVGAAGPTIQAAAHQGFPAIPWCQFVGCLWLAGAIAFLVFHGLRHYRFIRMVTRWGEQADDPRMLEALQKIKNDMGITRHVKLQICSCVSSPMMIGFLNPVILMPRSDFSADELPYILRHELVHFKRKDLWYKSLTLLATAIHWFNPVIYLMAKAIASQCEISCDAEVVNETDMDGRQRYSETIIGVIKRQSRMQTAFSTNFYGGKKGMKKRIFAIMDTKRKKAGVAILCLILMGTMGTGMAFAAASADDNIASSMVMTNNQTGLTSTDGGQTWIDEEEYQKMYPTSDVVWWTYDEYKAFVEKEKENLPNLIGEKYVYYDKDGIRHEEMWTQERVDNAIKQYEQTLEDIKKGALVSKSVNGDESLGMASNLTDSTDAAHAKGMVLNPSDSSSATISAVITLKNGETKDLGSYATAEECFAAVRAFCDEQVKAGNMTQQEADEILSQYK